MSRLTPPISGLSAELAWLAKFIHLEEDVIKSKSFDLTLAYCEVSALEEYLENNGTSLELVACGASYSASAHGVTIKFGSERDADKVWGLVLEATDAEDDEEEG